MIIPNISEGRIICIWPLTLPAYGCHDDFVETIVCHVICHDDIPFGKDGSPMFCTRIEAMSGPV